LNESTVATTDGTVGIIAALIAVVFFGSNFVVVKKYKTGDGLFFQLALSVGIWFSGIVINIMHPYSEGAPQFFPLAMLGGAVWCTGNLLAVPCIQAIGLAGGLIVWGSTNMIMGWACGAFGLLGVANQGDQIASWPLNVSGVVVAIAALFAAFFLKPEEHQDAEDEDEKDALLAQKPWQKGCMGGFAQKREVVAESSDWVQKLGPKKHVVGIILGATAGTLFGSAFNAAQHIMDNPKDYPGASPHGMDYFFAHCSGILMASITYFMIYCIYKGNTPAIYPKVAFPGFLSGLMWGIADAMWFVANENLQLVVSFPIITCGPGLVGALWGVFYLKELKGLHNYIVLSIICVLTVTSGVLVSLSHK